MRGPPLACVIALLVQGLTVLPEFGFCVVLEVQVGNVEIGMDICGICPTVVPGVAAGNFTDVKTLVVGEEITSEGRRKGATLIDLNWCDKMEHVIHIIFN